MESGEGRAGAQSVGLEPSFGGCGDTRTCPYTYTLGILWVVMEMAHSRSAKGHLRKTDKGMLALGRDCEFPVCLP